MSKDSHANNLRLLGSPVNLSYRGKKKEDRKNGRSRPRSALQNSGFNPDNQERYKRPFSADTKERPSTRSFLNTFSVELLQNYNYSPNNIKVVAPTTQLLGDSKTKHPNYNRDLCSNASDYGSEDTFISLGTKIKARAQSPKGKTHKNQIKYRNPIKKGKKTMESNDKNTNLYDMQVKIVGRENSPTRNKNFSNERCNSPYLTARPYPAYFLPLEPNQKAEDSLAGRVSFGEGSVNTEVHNAIESYNHRLSNTKQQLSLVEEESTQDIESIPSHNASSLSSENSLKEDKSTNDIEQDGRKIITDAKNKDYPKLTQNFVSDNKSYSSFYDDFPSNKTSYKNKMSSSLNVDTASKDSGYTDSGTNEEGGREFLTPTPASILKNNNLRGKNNAVQSKSLESIPITSNTELPKAISFDKRNYEWSEPLNHSRLLYKDFFLQKEGHIALAPQNSPVASTTQIPSTSDLVDHKPDGAENTDYPSYLLNSNTKAYTSKVIEDYKKEIAAINNLHELTIKDLQADAVSPTPLDIDKLFDPTSILNSSTQNFKDEIKAPPATEPSVKDKNDISKVSTQELIQNYLKVKEGDYSKNFKKCDKKNYNASTSSEGTSKSSWSNKSGPKIVPCKTPPIANKNLNQKNIFTLKAPLSARIDSVQNDKDIESWMSLAAPSPRITEIQEDNESIALDNSNQNVTSQNERCDEPSKTNIASTSTCEVPKTAHDIQKSKDLNANASVFDIYSMLKEIESYGENPFHVENKTATVVLETKNEERPATPKDNFLEIFQFLEKVEQSANDALSVVTNTTPQSIPKLEVLLKLPQTELAQRLVTASLQLEERSCCISLLQESLANHKEQMINKVSNLEKQSQRSVARVKQECEDAIKRHQAFIDQLINDKKTLNHRIEQLVDERRSLEERWRRSAQSLEERYKLELRNQHDKMLASQQVARQRWVRQKAEKIKELTVKGLEGELREMAERQQQEVTDLKLSHAEQISRLEGKHARAMDDLRKMLEEEAQTALMKERQMAASRLEKQILELESQYGEQRTRLVSEMRAENERVASELAKKEAEQKREIEKWKENQERMIEEKKRRLEQEMAKERSSLEEKLIQQKIDLEKKFEQYKREYEAEQQILLKKKVTEIAAQHKIERDREIEKAIETLEAEAQAGRKELQDALRRNKEQYEMELKELGETEHATLRRYQDAQARVRQTEDRCAELEVTINHLETRNKVLTEKNIELDRRISEIRTSCEENWKGKIELMNKEIEDLKKTHEEQMHQLYAKVKVAVARKDSAIQALTRESAKYQEKVTLLEQKLSQQRKDFLKQK